MIYIVCAVSSISIVLNIVLIYLVQDFCKKQNKELAHIKGQVAKIDESGFYLMEVLNNPEMASAGILIEKQEIMRDSIHVRYGG